MSNDAEIRLLAALDGSENSIRAVEYLAAMTKPEHKKVTLLHRFQKWPETQLDRSRSAATAPESEDKTKKRRLYIEGFMAKAKEKLVSAGYPEDAVTTTIQDVRDGPARDIVAGVDGFDAVLMGRKGMARLEDDIMGSVTSKVSLLLNEKPLIVVGPQPLVGKVLVAMDGSEGSQKACNFAGRLLAGSAADITLYHVVRKPRANGVFSDEELAEELDFIEDHVWHMKRRLGQDRDGLIGSGISADRISIKVDTDAYSRAGAIATEARKNGYTTIVMGRRGLSEVEMHPMGRVCSKVLQMVRNRAVWVVA